MARRGSEKTIEGEFHFDLVKGERFTLLCRLDTERKRRLVLRWTSDGRGWVSDLSNNPAKRGARPGVIQNFSVTRPSSRKGRSATMDSLP